MKIDLHVHSKSSDGAFTVEQIVEEANRRKIQFLSITDHDSITCQQVATDLVIKAGIHYMTGVELNITFSHPEYREGKPISLDFLGYQFDPENPQLRIKLEQMAKYREDRAVKILRNLNTEFEEEGIAQLTEFDFDTIQASIDGTLGRPHIADYLVKKGIVKSRQEAFDKYLVKCDVPKYPLLLDEASRLIHHAGGKLCLAHPNDPHGTSLTVLTKSLPEQTKIVQDSMLPFIDGIECWHSRSDAETTAHYARFAEEYKLIVAGGSDCHQKPILMGTVNVPEYVATQFM
jgi:predicted metal-dependent phosphoesterase TrpH